MNESLPPFRSLTLGLLALLASSAVLTTTAQTLASARTSAPRQAPQSATAPTGTRELRSLLSDLESTYGIRFNYRLNLVRDLKVVPVPLREFSGQVATRLNALLASTGLQCKALDGQTFVIQPKPAPLLVEAPARFPETTQPVETSSVERSVRGRVTGETGEGLPGVSVTLKGTTRGTVTTADGNFQLSIPEPSEGAAPAALVFSSVGYERQEVTVGNQTVVDIVLKTDTQSLGEVVVTALGIKRDVRSLGYSVQEVKGVDLTQAKEVNLANSLAGRMAGVQVTRAATGAGGSSKVVIRGNNSLVGNSQPLYVIDGVPMDNQNPNGPSRFGGIDYGDGISNINPEDIETISVLKGPNAAALYGQRGSNGVILITTKSGKSRKGIGVKYSLDYAVGDALVLPDFQDEYGQGLDGTFTNVRGNDGRIYTWAAARAAGIQGIPKTSGGRDRFTRASWGAKMQGQDYEDQWGNLLKFTPQPNTFQTFFNQEKQVTNNLSFDGGTDNVTYRLSLSNLHTDGYVPGNTLDRRNISLRTVAKLTPKLELDVKGNYINQKGRNRPTVSDAADNPAYLFISQPRSMGMDILAQSEWTANDVARQLGYGSVPFVGLEKTYATNSSTANPYWTAAHTLNRDDRQRLLGYVRLSYQFNDWIRLSARAGTDFYTDQRFRYREKGTYQSQNRNGDIFEEVTRTREDNSDVLLSLTPQVSTDFSLGLNLGANHQKYSSRTTGNQGTEFIAPNLYAINNTLTNTYVFGLYESSINSVYASGQVGFRDFWFVDVSARNDWSSTLSPANNSYFYPALSTSFVVTDAFGINSPALSFLKLRASWAQAGSSGSAYQLTGNYGLDQISHGGQPLASFTSVIPDPNLKNELTTSRELGVEARFFKNRLAVTAAYYSSSTKNQILNVPLPTSTTFSSRRINAGEIRNHGVEIALNGTVLKTTRGLTWEMGLNFSRNRNRVVSLAEGVSTYLLGDDRGVNVIAAPDKPFGTLIGNGFQWLRDTDGNRLIDPVTGLPLRTNAKILYEIGNAQPDFIGGFTNTLRYKNLTLSGLVDFSQGGKVYSQSVREELVFGTSKRTLPGRDGTYVAEGVVASKAADGTWVGTGQANTKQVTAQAYWNVVAPDKDNVVSEEMLNDASYVTMREITLNFQVPTRWLGRGPIKRVSVGAYGRNLFYFQRKTDGFAPEAAAFNVNNSSIGLESTALPLLRYVGFSLNLDL